MEDFKKRSGVEQNDKEIIYSQAIKAGKRIYYIDVKRNRKDELFLAITESKKIVSGEGEDVQVNYEKHKIFLYKEDFEKFSDALNKSIAFIKNQQNDEENADAEAVQAEEDKPLDSEIKIDIDF